MRLARDMNLETTQRRHALADLALKRSEAKREQMSKLLRRRICGEADGTDRPDGSPTLCLLERGHKLKHLYPKD